MQISYAPRWHNTEEFRLGSMWPNYLCIAITRIPLVPRVELETPVWGVIDATIHPQSLLCAMLRRMMILLAGDEVAKAQGKLVFFES